MKIAYKLGHVKNMDILIQLKMIIKPYPRARVSIGITKPFLLGVWTLRWEARSWVYFCYEKL